MNKTTADAFSLITDLLSVHDIVDLFVTRMFMTLLDCKKTINNMDILIKTIKKRDNYVD